jgi:hypothetical protein
MNGYKRTRPHAFTIEEQQKVAIPFVAFDEILRTFLGVAS